MDDIVKSLTSLPSEDGNFKSVLNKAEESQIKSALTIMHFRQNNDKCRIKKCEQELKRRKRKE